MRTWPGRAWSGPATERVVRAALAAILVISLGLRLWGSGFGLPAFAHYHPDEHALVERAWTILHTGDWQPERFNYPPFYAYAQVAMYAGLFLAGRGLGWWHDLLPFPLPEYYHLSRLSTALLGTATCLLTYLAGRQLYARQVGLLAAALLGGNYLHIIHSHYATLDVAVGFWATLALLFSARGLARARQGSFFLAGLWAGLAGATKYKGALALVLPLAALLLVPGQRGKQRLVFLALAVGGFGLGFWGANPLAVFHWDEFLTGLAAVGQHYATGQPGFEGLGNWLWYLGITLTSADAAWTLAGLAGLVGAALPRGGRQGLLLVTFPAAYFALVSSFVVRFERNLVPILPFLALGGGWLLSRAAGWLARRLGRPPDSPVRTWLAVAGVALLLALPLAAGVSFDRLLSRTDHREVAGRWLEQNVAPGARIAIEHYAIPFDHGAYDVTDVVRAADHDLAWYQDSGYDLLVVSDGIWEVLRDQRQYYGDRLRAYEQLTGGGTLLAEFVPEAPGLVVAGYPSVALYHLAPVRIYRLPGES